MVTCTYNNTIKLKKNKDHIAIFVSLKPEPNTFAQANTSPEWKQAMATKLNALAVNNIWQLVPPLLIKILLVASRSSKSNVGPMVLLTVIDFHEQEGINYHETFSPMVQPITIRMMLSIVVSN